MTLARIQPSRPASHRSVPMSSPRLLWVFTKWSGPCLHQFPTNETKSPMTSPNGSGCPGCQSVKPPSSAPTMFFNQGSLQTLPHSEFDVLIKMSTMLRNNFSKQQTNAWLAVCHCPQKPTIKVDYLTSSLRVIFSQTQCSKPNAMKKAANHLLELYHPPMPTVQKPTFPQTYAIQRHTSDHAKDDQSPPL